MSKIIGWLKGKKTYLLVLVYVGLQLWQGGGLEALQNPETLDQVTLAAVLAAIRAGVSKMAAGSTSGAVLPLLLAALVIAPGCAIVGGQDESLRPVLKRTILDDQGAVMGTVEVSLGSELASRGCIAMDVSPEGATDFILQQDGSSDWSTIRAIASIGPEIVAVVMNPVTTSVDAIIQALGGRVPMETPSPTHGCEGLFE